MTLLCSKLQFYSILMKDNTPQSWRNMYFYVLLPVVPVDAVSHTRRIESAKWVRCRIAPSTNSFINLSLTLAKDQWWTSSVASVMNLWTHELFTAMMYVPCDRDCKRTVPSLVISNIAFYLDSIVLFVTEIRNSSLCQDFIYARTVPLS